MRSALQPVALITALAFWGTVALAQAFPDFTSTTVNDFAGLVPDADERTLRTRLEGLKRDTGIEMTVVTLPTQAPYAPNMEMEAFATALFDHWGVGDAARDDGIMVLVLPQDRAMRIELGAGFGQGWNGHAERIVARDFLPAFRAEEYARGIMAGSLSVIEEIAVPFAEGATRPAGDYVRFAVMGVLGVLFVVLLRVRAILDYLARLRACAQCGTTGTLRVSRRTILRATPTTPGQKEKTTYCTACDYRDTIQWQTARVSTSRSRGSGGSFGGGRSGGGGASGRW